ncbi:MAG: precorrin-6y C5,15-methyltransferase (decarboxylating) subunit CbiE [Lachnoclostridium sp.]|nr:precorrin-6y C5,15-methyltransferase (decarboxylating) subunit CbiE [Lachnoclostridium sp.]
MCREERQIYLIGIGMGTTRTLTEEGNEALQMAELIIGAERMTAPFEKMGRNCLREYRPSEVCQFLESHPEYRICAIVLSGDTGFYSGAKGMAEKLGGMGEIHWIPGISSVAYLAARLGTSWEDAALVSVHGRFQNAVYAIAHNRKTFLLTDQKSGGQLYDKLRYYPFENVTVHIGNNLSYETERIVSGKPEELHREDFGELAVVMVENDAPDSRVCHHLKDEEFIRLEGEVHVPMTKEAVRTLSIGALELTKNAVLYDIGAGTGSVSIEAAGMAPGIRVIAVEKKEEACELIRKNCRKFKTDQVEVIPGMAPEILEQMEELEPPTHVFIGGSSGNLKEILRFVRGKNPNARIVINAILLETVCEIMDAVKEGLIPEPQIQQVMVSGARTLGSYHMMQAQNPVYIVSTGGEKGVGQ